MDDSSSKAEDRQISAIILGGGNRGQNYAEYGRFFPKRFRLVAIADPRSAVRAKLQKTFSLNEDQLYEDWRQLADAKVEKLADCALITLPDREHYQAAIEFAKKGYHILLEKPMATKLEHCKEIVRVCRENNVLLAVCHVLRYLPVVKKIKQLIDSNVIGRLISIQHIEPVGFWHFAHSFVRGNWHNESESSFSLLAKCCHDLDLIQYWMQPRRCTEISSFGKLMHFRKENKPNGAADRCLNCSIEQSCPYSAKKIYLEKVNRRWPVSVVVPDIEDHHSWDDIKIKVEEALKTGPYGKCVYGDCDNDVVDQQVVIMNFDDGATATMQMIAFSEQICQRTSRLFGTHGELTWKGDDTIVHYDFLTQKQTVYNEEDLSAAGMMSGHGGADFFAMDSFVRALSFNDPKLIGTGPDDSLNSHILAFAAETARKEKRLCKLDEFL